MNSPNRTLLSIAVYAVAVLGVFGLSVLVTGDPVVRRPLHQVGRVDDWSFHHLVYSNPGTYDHVKNNREKYARWLKIQYDSRYLMQQMKRSPRSQASGSAHSTAKTPASGLLSLPGSERAPVHTGPMRPHLPKSALKNDWAENINTGTVLPNMYPATFSANNYTSPSCANDYAEFPTGSAGDPLAANIMAFNNLYQETCSAPTVPTVYWAYNTGTGYAVTTSPVISLDGSMIAYLQTDSSNDVQLVVLKWSQSGGDVTSPQPITINPTNGMNCSAPCATATTISSNGDAYSSPFYDYASDSIYFGDNASNLWKVTPVFYSTSNSLNASSVMLNSTSYDVASPVFDSTSGCVFVSDSEGYLYSVDAGIYTGGTGEVCTSGSFQLYGQTALLGNGGANEGIFDAPLLDSVAETVYAFVTDAGSFGSCSGKNCVMQFKAGPSGSQTITPGCATCTPANQEALGTGGAGYNLYAGTFDNNYYSTGAGSLYVVGDTGLSTGGAILYHVPINSSNVMSTPGTGPTVNVSSYPWPSPVTEFYNPTAVETAATGTVTVASDPCTWTYDSNNIGPNIVIGGTTYEFVNTSPGPTSNNVVQVETVTGVNPCMPPPTAPDPNSNQTAANLYAAINANTLLSKIIASPFRRRCRERL